MICWSVSMAGFYLQGIFSRFSHYSQRFVSLRSPNSGYQKQKCLTSKCYQFQGNFFSKNFWNSKYPVIADIFMKSFEAVALKTSCIKPFCFWIDSVLYNCQNSVAVNVKSSKSRLNKLLVPSLHLALRNFSFVVSTKTW